jgi:F0F1-type ATP synthase epsilon subunit
MADDDRTFQCVLIAPSGKLLDCRTPSAVVPAHDGQVGVMADHMPMFCKLGLGIMEVKTPTTDTQAAGSSYFLIDGGFAMVVENLLKVVSYQVVSPAGLKPEALDHLRATLNKDLQAHAPGEPEHLHLTRKLFLLNHAVELASQAT